jgi:cytochrome c biogenesis protein CcmG/thiol:disulfide interchange protein DsbE
MTNRGIFRLRPGIERRLIRRALRSARGLGAVMIMIVAATSAFDASSMAAEPGSLAPSFEVPGASGAVKLSAYRGKLVYLDFWASWCGPCKRSFPWMNQLQAKYGAQGLQVLAVNLDGKHADALDFLSATPTNFTIGFDPEGTVATQYEVIGMPSSVLIGPDGKVVAMHAGFNEADKAELENLVSQNLHRMKNQ